MAHALSLSLDVIILLIIIGIILYIFKALIVTKNNLFTANLYFLISFIALLFTQIMNVLISFDVMTTNILFELVKNIFRFIFLILLMIGSYKYSKLLYNSANKLSKDRLNKKTKKII